MKRRMLWAVMYSLSCAMLFAASSKVDAQTVTAIPKLDLTRFSGVWFELASYPSKREKHCAGNGQMLFALGDKANHVQLVNSCKTKAGYTEAANIDGKTQDKNGDGKLKLGFWPFYKKYWVLAEEPDDKWSLVGSPNHKNLWIYSRTVELAPETLAEIRAKAAAQGFALEKLTMTPQGLE